MLDEHKRNASGLSGERLVWLSQEKMLVPHLDVGRAGCWHIATESYKFSVSVLFVNI